MLLLLLLLLVVIILLQQLPLLLPLLLHYRQVIMMILLMLAAVTAAATLPSNNNDANTAAAYNETLKHYPGAKDALLSLMKRMDINFNEDLICDNNMKINSTSKRISNKKLDVTKILILATEKLLEFYDPVPAK
jgi:hypothetical protein